MEFVATSLTSSLPLWLTENDGNRYYCFDLHRSDRDRKYKLQIHMPPSNTFKYFLAGQKVLATPLLSRPFIYFLKDVWILSQSIELFDYQEWLICNYYIVSFFMTSCMCILCIEHHLRRRKKYFFAPPPPF